ncbi:MAG TPA: YceD family protein [Bacillota bacterium]|nr:YceD family protein [Bacillota bacterium]
MKFTLGQIRKNAHRGPMKFAQEVDVSELESMNNDIRKIKPVQIDGTCYFQGEKIIFSFTMTGEMILPCARTLVDVVYPFTIKANEMFTTSSDYSDDHAEEGIHPVEGEVIDLMPYIKENILLSVPYRVFSDDPQAVENMPTEGKDWKMVTPEEMEKEKSSIDPRMKKLESLLKKNNDK